MTNEKLNNEELAKAALNSFGNDTARALRLFDESVAFADRLGPRDREELVSEFVDGLRQRIQERRARSRARLRHLLADAGRALKQRATGEPECPPGSVKKDSAGADQAA